MVSWWTVVRLYQSYRLLQARNALPVAPNTTYPLQTDNAFVPSVAEMRDSSSSASLVAMTWLWLTWSIQFSAWTSFKMEKANAASLIHEDAVSQIATRWKSFRWTTEWRRRCIVSCATAEQSRNSNQRHRHMDVKAGWCRRHLTDRRVTLCDTGRRSVDQTFLQQRKRQRDMHNKQLRAPVIVPAPMTTQVSSETQSVYPPFSPLEGEPQTSSSADHDTCT